MPGTSICEGLPGLLLESHDLRAKKRPTIPFLPSTETSLPTLCLIDNGLFQPGSTHTQGEDFSKYISVGRCFSPCLPQRVSLNTSSTFLLLLLTSAVLVGPLAKDQSDTVLVEEAGTGPMDTILFTVPSTFATVEGNCHCTVSCIFINVQYGYSYHFSYFSHWKLWNLINSWFALVYLEYKF